MATRGSQVFNSGDELGSTIAVSCDMCHPDALNTRREIYPKFQPQLGRTVLLRDALKEAGQRRQRTAEPFAGHNDDGGVSDVGVARLALVHA